MRSDEMTVRVRRAHARAIAALVLSLLALSLGACGSSGSSGSSSVAVTGPLASAAYATSRVGGAHMSVSARIAAGSLSAPITMTGGGFFNYKLREGTLSLNIAGFPATAFTGSSATMEEIYTGTSIYMASSLFAGKLPGGARWMKLDLARFDSAAGVDPSHVLNGESNPAQFLEYLKASGSSVQVVGSEAVRGVQTTHYRGTIDLDKAAGVLAQHGGSRALHEAFEKESAKLGLRNMPVEVWVDGHSLVRRMEFALGIPGGHGSIAMTIELFDFGATPSVNTPAPSETFDATSGALQGLGSLGG